MHCLPLLLALSGSAAAASYSLTIVAPDTVVNNAQLEAAGLGFYTGLDGPSTYCPEVGNDCPPVEGTLVWGPMASMAVSLPAPASPSEAC